MVPLADIDLALLAEYEEIVKEYFIKIYPDRNWNTGSQMYENIVRPMAITMASQETDLETLRRSYALSLLTAQASPDPAMVAAIASNFRLTSMTGRPASGELVAYTALSSNTYIYAGTQFTVGGITLVTEKTYIGTDTADVYTDAADVVYVQYVPIGDLYAFTFPVVSTVNTALAVGEGQEAVMSSQNTQIQRVEVASAIGGGAEDESASGLAAQAAEGVTARVPSGDAHLRALLQAYTSVNVMSMASFGIGDPEMLRDRNNVFLFSGGGRVDCICRTAQLPAISSVTRTATALGDDRWALSIEAEDCPGFYHIVRIEQAGVVRQITNQDEIDMEFRAVQEDGGPEVFSGTTARYSIYQAASIEFTFPGVAGATADFTVYTMVMPQLATLQAYVNRADVRNEAQDVLIRAPVPCFVGLSAKVLKPAETTAAEAAIQAVVATALNALPIGAGAVTAAYVVQAVTAAYPDFKVDFPILFTSRTYMPDGTVLYDSTPYGKISARVDAVQGVSVRNTVFLCLPEDVNITLEDM